MSSNETTKLQARDWIFDPRNRWKIYLLAWSPLALAYLAVLGLYFGITGLTLVTTILANIFMPMLLGVGVCWGVLNLIIKRSIRDQVAIHTVGSVIFSLIWARGEFRLFQLSSGLLTGDWSPTTWPSAALAWQLFLGLSIYFTLVSATYAFWALEKLSRSDIAGQDMSDRVRIFAKSSNVIQPVHLEDIRAVRSIEGITYIFTKRGRLESRLGISELERRLPDRDFLRVHRSALIGLNHVHSIEPAGNGRMTVHLSDGTSLESSRAGTNALKRALSIV